MTSLATPVIVLITDKLMRKEIILAIVLGVILGVVIIFGINLANQAATNSSNPPDNQATPTVTITPTPTPTLQVLSPTNNSVSFKDSILLMGKTLENSLVAIISTDDEVIIKADQSGNFEQEIELTGGENIISITAANGSDYKESVEITIIYTSAEISSVTPTISPEDSDQEEATDSATKEYQNLIKRLQDRAKDNQTDPEDNNLKGYVGIINKISNLSLVVNTPQNNLLQVTTDEDTDVVKNGKDIKASTLSIDEKIIIMGFLNTEDILHAKRIVAIPYSDSTLTRQVLTGTISNLDIESLEFSLGELSIGIPKKLDLDLEELVNDQQVITIVETDTEDDTHTLLLLQPLLQ